MEMRVRGRREGEGGGRGERHSGVARGGGDRWIGFAGSPRGERPRKVLEGTDGVDGMGEEMLGSENSVPSASREGNERNDRSEDTDTDVHAVLQEDGGAEPEGVVEEELDEKLSGASR